MITNIKKLLGLNSSKAVVKEKTAEADEIVKEINKDIQRTARKVNRLNRVTNSKIEEIGKDLESIAYKIAVATGGKNRGLK